MKVIFASAVSHREISSVIFYHVVGPALVFSNSLLFKKISGNHVEVWSQSITMPMHLQQAKWWSRLGAVCIPLQCCHNGHDGVSNHQPFECLLNRLFRRRSKKTSKLCLTGLMRGIHRWPVNSPHKGPVARKMFPFDDVIMPDRDLVDLAHWDWVTLIYVSELNQHWFW